ncbi:MAG: class I SAM-dependent methyltransferase [bacterium]
MLKELLHFTVHAPSTLAMKRKLSHVELYDTLMLRAEDAGLAKWRAALVEDVAGRVLEIGCGTGLMFQHYNPGASLSAIEPEAEFLESAKKRAESSPAQVFLALSDGQMLPFHSDSFDYVIVSLVLCSVPSVKTVLDEIKRVLKDGGELRLIEHVRSTRPLNGLVMDILNPLWRALNNQGCNMNRETESALEKNGFELKEVKPFKTFTPGLPAFPNRWIKASLARSEKL